MHRQVEKTLSSWKNDPNRYPLLVRGARQVGKSYSIEQFGKQAFENLVTINFEFQPQLKSCFTTLDPIDIINKIQILLGQEVHAGKTLLFLDEIQECPQAIMSLRYFKEKCPEQAVIGAGSLLEFALKKEGLHIPVGRIQFLHIAPLSFSEFLEALGHQKILEYLTSYQLANEIDNDIHLQCLELLRLYLILGGMPAILNAYFENHDLMKCSYIQTSLLQTFRADFGKYANTPIHKYLEKVFDAAPRLVGQRIKYVSIDTNMKSRDIKNAIDMLALAEVIHPIYHSVATGLPLGAEVNEKKFKLSFLDVGLMQNSCGLNSRLSMESNFIQINSGAVAEQFVGQELLAYANSYQQKQLFFWARDKKNSQAEVDYIIDIDSKIIPIEVKSGKTGRLKSLKLFMDEKKSDFGVRISQDKLTFSNQILSIPLYMIEQIPRLVKSL
ncbi:MAG: hypothetical protein COS89_01225 [Deltaproteobacteria bacterium CG07_land_8_20_14_0_80_38_7]|nr:MAG: hypothetical protein COS89_01225 [Deltaproteobacteria bacterium CG07_land_8_20_14_0_80_38_7]